MAIFVTIIVLEVIVGVNERFLEVSARSLVLRQKQVSAISIGGPFWLSNHVTSFHGSMIWADIISANRRLAYREGCSSNQLGIGTSLSQREETRGTFVPTTNPYSRM